MRIVIVGHGHYAKDLIIPAYEKAGISYTVNDRHTDTIDKGAVYDLCIPSKAINSVIKRLASKGIRKFVLPKPIAETKQDLVELLNTVKKYKLRCFVASQWVYDSELIRILKDNNTIGLELTVSRWTNTSYFRHSISAYLPHLLQLEAMAKRKSISLSLDLMAFPFFTICRLCVLDTQGNISDYNMRHRPDHFRPMIKDMANYFDKSRQSKISLTNYLPIAKRYIQCVSTPTR